MNGKKKYSLKKQRISINNYSKFSKMKISYLGLKDFSKNNHVFSRNINNSNLVAEDFQDFRIQEVIIAQTILEDRQDILNNNQIQEL